MLSIRAISGQSVNCEAYKDDSLYYKACLIYTKACVYPQGSKEAQIMLDEAIKICPYFGAAYYVKSIPYLKRGEFIEWKRLIDNAVECNPEQYLGYRGGARFQFLRDYAGAINDIERADSLFDFDIGYIYNGDYHLHIARALCYKGIGKKKKAVEIIEKQLKSPGYSACPFDYLHLGVLKLELKNYDGAISCFNKQLKNNNYLAETYYYLGLAYKHKGDKNLCLKNLYKSKEFYLEGKHLPGQGSYMDYMDRIYYDEIEKAINTIVH